MVVTSRQHVIQDQTLSWLDEHFPGLFKVRAVESCASVAASLATWGDAWASRPARRGHTLRQAAGPALLTCVVWATGRRTSTLATTGRSRASRARSRTFAGRWAPRCSSTTTPRTPGSARRRVQACLGGRRVAVVDGGHAGALMWQRRRRGVSWGVGRWWWGARGRAGQASQTLRPCGVLRDVVATREQEAAAAARAGRGGAGWARRWPRLFSRAHACPRFLCACRWMRAGGHPRAAVRLEPRLPLVQAQGLVSGCGRAATQRLLRPRGLLREHVWPVAGDLAG